MLTDEAIEMITVALENNKSLEKLVIEHHQQLTSQSAIALADLLQTNSSTLIALTLNATSIGDEGSQSIAKALKTNRSLKKLFLTDCRITDIGVIGLNESLKVNATLEVLNLNDNQINNSGALIIADGLKENRSLKHVFIRGNKFSRSDEGGKALLSAAQNRRIEIIF
jgi:Ran GTPase-activating protein (RanGAP) involved in mRNA processing and transport